jgi:hypothetical protein
VAKQPRRLDFSHSLVHLTRERHEYSSSDPATRKLLRVVSAFDVLREILTTGVLRGSGNEGYIKGSRRAVCFSEIPLSAMHLFAVEPSVEISRSHSYRPYGIVLSKVTVFSAGGRPVIYLPDSEGHWIPAEEKWRHVRFEPPQVDFTHEREWRVPGDLDLKGAALYVIVWHASDAKELTNFASPLSKRILGIIPMEHITGML